MINDKLCIDELLNPKPLKIHTCKRCGYNMAIPENLLDYELLYKEERERNIRIICSINTAMQDCEKLYSMNPFKDALIKRLTELRDEFNKEL